MKHIAAEFESLHEIKYILGAIYGSHSRMNTYRKINQHPTHTYGAHPPYWLASCPTTPHDEAIRNLHTFISRDYKIYENKIAKTKFTYVDKWLLKTQINQKIIQPLLEIQKCDNVQITQILKFRYA